MAHIQPFTKLGHKVVYLPAQVFGQLRTVYDSFVNEAVPEHKILYSKEWTGFVPVACT